MCVCVCVCIWMLVFLLFTRMSACTVCDCQYMHVHLLTTFILSIHACASVCVLCLCASLYMPIRCRTSSANFISILSAENLISQRLHNINQCISGFWQHKREICAACVCAWLPVCVHMYVWDFCPPSQLPTETNQAEICQAERVPHWAPHPQDLLI